MFGMSQCCDQWRSQTRPEVLSMRNSNCRGSAAEHGGTRWELCALRSSSAKKRLFFVDNTDGQVDTHEGKNLFHATAMTVYQRQLR